MTRKQLGQRIAELRFKKFGNIKTASEQLNVYPNILRRIELGKTQKIDVFFISKLNHIFGVNLFAEIQEGEDHE